MIFLVFLPLILTVFTLLAIMVFRRPVFEMDDDDYENHHEIIRVAVYDEKAYWVHNSILYVAEITKEPDFETAKPLDVHSLSHDEVDKIFSILDELKSHVEGE